MQEVIDRAVNIATKAAIGGNPVKRIIWVPPQTASQDPGGNFAIEYCGPMGASETEPWDKN